MSHFYNNLFKLLYVIVFLFKSNFVNTENKIPSYLKICHRSDPNLNECVQNSIELLRPKLISGLKEIGIPPLEPLIINEVMLDQGRGMFRHKSIFRNLKIFGPTKFQLKSVNIDLDKNIVHLKLWFPILKLISDYQIEGRILIMPIVGKGFSQANYSNIDATVTMQNENILKDNKEYLNVKDFIANFNVGDASIHLDNLFESEPDLGNAMNKFFNDNWKDIAIDMQPLLEDKIAEILKKFCNKIYSNFPLSSLLPP